MKESTFRKSLPVVTFCDRCGAVLSKIAWTVDRFGARQWFAIGISKCEACSWVRMAAAGSDQEAHAFAQLVRQKFMASISSK